MTTISTESRARAGSAMVACVLAWLAATQISPLRHSMADPSNGLTITGDPYGEADAIRSAQHYAEFGFFTDAGLPHVVYGNRFPNEGWVTDLYRYPLPSGVYTRNPPLANLICGVLEKLLGFKYLWAWRLVPVSVGLLTTWWAFLTLRRVVDPLAAGIVILLVSVIPMATSHLHCLHYEGYAHSAFLAELVIITRILFSGLPTSAFSYGIVFALGLLQGFFSFDYVFVATGAAIPLALLARENGRSVEVRLVARLVALSGAGFAIAHLLHFWQVAHFYGSVSAALNDFSSRATYRFVGAGPTSSYLTQVMYTFERYSRELWLSPGGLHFGAFLLLFSAFSVSGIVRGTNGTAGTNVGQWRLSLMAKGNCAVMLFVAYGIGAVWLMAMPSYCRIHPHVVPRIFFLPYYVAVLAVALRLFGSDAAMERANP